MTTPVFRVKHRLEFRERLETLLFTRAVVRRDRGFRIDGWEYRAYFRLQLFPPRSKRALVRLEGKSVLFAPSDSMLAGQQFGGLAHVQSADGIG